jgi:hypothetical protein
MNSIATNSLRAVLTNKVGAARQYSNTRSAVERVNAMTAANVTR